MISLPRRLKVATCAFALFANIPSLPVRAETTAVAPAAIRPALWKVADEDTVIWLFGTIHVLPERVEWHSGTVGSAFDASHELVTEISMTDPASAQDAIARMSLRSDGKTLRDALAPPARADYEKAMASLGLPIAAFDANDTWLAALMLTLMPLRAAGYSTNSGIDGRVAASAKERQMANSAFETPEYQIGLFDALPEETQQAYLAEVIKALPTVRTDIDAMVAAWKAGDADHLAQMLNEDESDPQMRAALITNRNANWAKWIKARLDKPGTVFVAVGAGHLAGLGSVQDQLAKAGIDTTRVQ